MPPAKNANIYSSICLWFFWSRPRELNPEPTVYDTVALPIELGRHNYILSFKNLLPNPVLKYFSLKIFTRPQRLSKSLSYIIRLAMAGGRKHCSTNCRLTLLGEPRPSPMGGSYFGIN